MPSNKLQNYLRTFRKRSYLSQDDVAFLLGSQSGAKVSRYENFSRRPVLETALAYELIFRVPARKLFAGVFQKVEQAVLKRAETLARRLAKSKPNRVTARRLEALKAISPELANQSGEHP